MDNIVKTYSPQKLNQEEIYNFNKPIIGSETESTILKKKKVPYKQKSSIRWLQRQILPNIQRRTYTDPSQALPKD